MINLSKKVYWEGFAASNIIKKSSIIDAIINELSLYKYLAITDLEIVCWNLKLAWCLTEYATHMIILLLAYCKLRI